MKQEITDLIKEAIHNENDLVALSAANKITDEKYLKLIAEETKHRSVKWIALQKITDIEFLKKFSSDDPDINQSVKERIDQLQKKQRPDY